MSMASDIDSYAGQSSQATSIQQQHSRTLFSASHSDVLTLEEKKTDTDISTANLTGVERNPVLIVEEDDLGGYDIPNHPEDRNPAVCAVDGINMGNPTPMKLPGDEILYDPANCDAVFETMDSCVGCVEGVDYQHEYEEKLLQALHRKAFEKQHDLSEQEATMIRLQVMEESNKNRNVNENNGRSGTAMVIPDFDMLNICGNEEDMYDAQKTFVLPEGISEPSMIPPMNCDDQSGAAVDYGRMAAAGCAPHSCAPSNQEATALQCVICRDEASMGQIGSSAVRVTFANLPCCNHEQKVCTACILVLSSPTEGGDTRIGRCPRCRQWVEVKTPECHNETAFTINTINSKGKCEICNQEKDHLVEGNKVCDACYLGRRQPLLYECQQCLMRQRIPHPMYRSQRSATEFGDHKWTCQKSCKKFTKWRIVPEEVPLIPVGDAPESWGMDYQQQARKRVQIMREGILRNNFPMGAGAAAAMGDDDYCIIQ